MAGPVRASTILLIENMTLTVYFHTSPIEKAQNSSREQNDEENLDASAKFVVEGQEAKTKLMQGVTQEHQDGQEQRGRVPPTLKSHKKHRHHHQTRKREGHVHKPEE